MSTTSEAMDIALVIAGAIQDCHEAIEPDVDDDTGELVCRASEGRAVLIVEDWRGSGGDLGARYRLTVRREE